VRQVKVVETGNGRRYKVRYRLGGRDTSETFTQIADARMFRDIIGNGRGDRVEQAMRWLRDRQAVEGSQAPTFGEWFETYVDQLTGITQRTRSDYRSMHRRYLSHLDPLPLTLITRTHVTTLVNDLDRAGRAAKTIKQTVHLLSTCLGLAIDEGHLTANPCRRVRLPSAKLEAVEARFLSYEEADHLVWAMPMHYRPLVVFLLGTGMRWSEATAIETRHVNMTAGTVRVEQAWKRVPGEGMVKSTPKTRKSKRTVNPATMALAAVKPLLRKPSDLVFVTPSGGPVSHSNFHTNIWQPACRAAGIVPAPRIHDLRHTHASWLLSDGISLEAVQDQLGHESMETTRKVYAHLIPAVGVAVGKAASLALNRALSAGLLGETDLRLVEKPIELASLSVGQVGQAAADGP